MSEIRDQLRAATVGHARSFEHRELEINGKTIEVRQPTVAQRALIFKKAGMAVGKPEGDIGELGVWAAIWCCYVPGTDERIFDQADAAALKQLPAGGWLDDVVNAAIELIAVTPGKAAEALPETPSDC